MYIHCSYFFPTAVLPAAVIFFTALYRYRSRTKRYTKSARCIIEQDTIKHNSDIFEQNGKTTIEGTSSPDAVRSTSKAKTSSSTSDSESCQETTLEKIKITKDCTEDFIQLSPKVSTESFCVPASSSFYDHVISCHDPIASSSYGRVPSFRDPIESTYDFDFSATSQTLFASCDYAIDPLSSPSNHASSNTLIAPFKSSGVRTPSQYACAPYSCTPTPSSPCVCFAASVDTNSFSQHGRVFAVGEFIKSGSYNLKVLDILGQGGQAILYQVQDETSVYAAKVSHFDFTPKGLLHEYDILSGLSHPNVVSVFQEIPRGFLLECLFEDLFSLIERDGPLPSYDRDNIALGIAQAVSYLHSSGIAHLDIKPDNVLLTDCRIPKLADFVLAMRFLNEDGSIRYLGEFYSSFAYSSPELIRLHDPVDMSKTDCWSLGVTFFVMMSGNLPFACSGEGLLFNQVNENYYFTNIMELRIRNDPVYSRFMDMIRALCNIDPQARFSAFDALSFYWGQIN